MILNNLMKVLFFFYIYVNHAVLKSYYLWVIFAEETFIVLDKDLVVGNFSHGEPHVEGQYSFLPSFLCLSRNLGKERFFFLHNFVFLTFTSRFLF